VKNRIRQSALTWSKFDLGFITLAIVVVAVTRWLYHATYLFHWDSVQFALGMQGMDILHHRPHPPGYVFYVWLGNLAKLFTHDDNLALILVGILATIVGVLIIYLFARSLFRHRLPAVLAVLFFIFNTSVWFHGIVAEVYIVESVIALVAIWRLYLYWKIPSWRNLVLAIGLLGLVGGFRQTTELALIPLAIFVLWQTGTNFKRWLIAAGVLLLSNLTWLVPILINTGGIGAYWHGLATLSDVVIGQYYRSRGFFVHAVNNLNLVGEALSVAVVAELIVLMLASALYLIRGTAKQYQIIWPQVWFWLLAIGGQLVLTITILMTNPGYVLLPVILIGLLSAGGIWQLMLALQPVSLRLAQIWAIGGTVIIIGSQVFNFYVLKPEQFAFVNPALPSVTRHDELLDEIVQTIRNNSVGKSVAVWINVPNTIIFFGFRHMQYYLPDLNIYRGLPESLVHPEDKTVWHAKGPNYEVYEDKVYIADSTERLFTLRDTWDALHKQYEIPITMPDGHTLVYYDLTDSATRDYLSTNYNFVFLKDAETQI